MLRDGLSLRPPLLPPAQQPKFFFGKAFVFFWKGIARVFPMGKCYMPHFLILVVVVVVVVVLVVVIVSSSSSSNSSGSSSSSSSSSLGEKVEKVENGR